MRSLTIASPAKVNLFLRVLGRRPDGYHELVTLFHRISLCDQLRLKKIRRPSFRLVTSGLKLGPARANLIYKAFQALRKVASWEGGVEVTLEKRIPVAAGLGGGSSNAAHFLLGMNRLFQLGLSGRALIRMGALLGSDIPFFLYEVNQAVGTGRGEKIKPLASSRKFWFVLVVQSIGIPTSRVYQRLGAPPLTRISRAVTITSALSAQVKKGEQDHYLHNDLFAAGCSIRPELRQIDLLFDELGASRRLMSGSGPTLFSIHRSKREAEHIARRIRRRMRSVDVFVCHTV